MKFAVPPKVATHGTAYDSPYYDKFFIHAKPWPSNPDTVLYLHLDGAWRPSVFSEENAPTGYFDTEEEAEQLLASQANHTLAA